MTKRVISIAFAVMLLGLLGVNALAQTKTNAYYDAHPSEILPDAQTAFRAGQYDRALELCRLHYTIVGDSRANALREKAQECARLTIEMNALKEAQSLDAAKAKAQAILALNPDDRAAKELSANNPASGVINGHEYVDLGLSVKWATCNVGASSPSDYGYYFAWGETRPKSEYTWENCAFHVTGDSPDNLTFNKYNTKSKHGTVDNNKRLDYSDDAARANWGGTWRMPTRAERDELHNQCTWTWTTQGGKNGYKVTSKTNGNSIFLPAAGYWRYTELKETGSRGGYWTSSLLVNDPYYASVVGFHSGSVDMYGNARYYGMSVRPVTE